MNKFATSKYISCPLSILMYCLWSLSCVKLCQVLSHVLYLYCITILLFVLRHYFLSCVIVVCRWPFFTWKFNYFFIIMFHRVLHFFLIDQPFANRVALKPVFLTELFDTNFMIIVCLLDWRLKLDGILVPHIFTFLYFLTGPDTCR